MQEIFKKIILEFKENINLKLKFFNLDILKKITLLIKVNLCLTKIENKIKKLKKCFLGRILMISRYSNEKMSRIWTDEYKFQKMLDVEILICQALQENGDIPEKDFIQIKEKAKFNIERVKEIEKEVKHDVIAFLTSVSENVGESSKYIHKGVTSSDVLDTALSLQLKESISIIKEDLKNLLEILKELALKFKNIPCIGRTHGIHAQPITLGLKFALWYSDMQRNLQRLKEAEKRICVGKISGAVGTFSEIEPFVEEFVCQKLGIENAAISTQIIQRDRIAEYLSLLALICSMIEKIAVELRNLQRTEVGELQEKFSKNQKGSSAMPHKKNPISAEQIVGLSRIVRSNSLAGLETVALWHERDLTNSSAERITLPDSSILTDYILVKLTNVLKNIEVNEKNVERNLNLTNGAFFSQKFLLALLDKGMLREKAYPIIQEKVFLSYEKNIPLKDVLIKDEEILAYLSKEEIEKVFEMKNFLNNIDYIYKRLNLI